MSLLHRPVTVLAAGALALSGLVVVSPSGGPAGAAESTTNVTFRDCEVREDPYGTNNRIKDNITWTTPVRLNLPTPVRAGVEITAEAQFGALPTNLLPVDLDEFEIDSTVSFAVDERSDLGLSAQNVAHGSYAPATPVALQELEVDTYWSEAGTYVHRPKDVYFEMTGYDAGDVYREYTFACDNLLDPPTLLTVAVYDPSASPAIVIDRLSAKQGQTIRVTGQHLLAAAPTNPAARGTITIGGVVVGTVAIDQTGAFVATVRVPAYARPGPVQVHAANGARSASTALQVTAVKGKVIAAPKVVKRGKKVKLTGSRFKAGEKVTVVLKGGRGAGKKAFKATVKVRANGTFTKPVRLKKPAKGTWRVTATGAASKRVARTSFKVR